MNTGPLLKKNPSDDTYYQCDFHDQKVLFILIKRNKGIGKLLYL